MKLCEIYRRSCHVGNYDNAIKGLRELLLTVKPLPSNLTEIAQGNLAEALVLQVRTQRALLCTETAETLLIEADTAASRALAVCPSQDGQAQSFILYQKGACQDILGDFRAAEKKTNAAETHYNKALEFFNRAARAWGQDQASRDAHTVTQLKLKAHIDNSITLYQQAGSTGKFMFVTNENISIGIIPATGTLQHGEGKRAAAEQRVANYKKDPYAG
mmetsp:Transcript_13639/g.20341  ORF Transcript_13639/g.20341 Transcript_13639/m.20341 type:complete len:217 (-) Transcript_13639:442-1092(-)